MNSVLVGPATLELDAVDDSIGIDCPDTMAEVLGEGGTTMKNVWTKTGNRRRISVKGSGG